MRHWNQVIIINGPTSFEQNMANLLTEVANTRVGAVLLNVLCRKPIQAGEIRLKIMPVDHPNAIQVNYGVAADATAAGTPLRNGFGQPLGTGQAGTGRGTGSTLRFHLRPTWSITPAAGLVHELMHVARGFQGHVTGDAVQNIALPNEEEFYSILVENIYASSQGGDRIRWCHNSLGLGLDQLQRERLEAQINRNVFPVWMLARSHVVDAAPTPFTARAAGETVSQRWARTCPRLLDNFIRTEPYMAEMLRHVPARFNPIRDRVALRVT